MINKFLTYCFFVTLLCATATGKAEEIAVEQPRWFQVELIFFEPVNSSPSGELWPEPNKETIAEPQVMELSAPLRAVVIKDNPGITPRAFQLLDPANFAMDDIDKQLQRSRQYRVLSHIAWRQPTVELANSRAVHVHNELMQTSPAGQAFRQKRFDGTVMVSLARYLHLKTDIMYYNPEVNLAEQIARQDINTANIEHFRLQESRRMRSNEIHYIDHPYFGVIAMITPYQPGAQ